MDYDRIEVFRKYEDEDLPYMARAFVDHDQVVDENEPLWSTDVVSVRVYGADLIHFDQMTIIMRQWHDVEFFGTADGPRLDIKDNRG